MKIGALGSNVVSTVGGAFGTVTVGAGVPGVFGTSASGGSLAVVVDPTVGG